MPDQCQLLALKVPSVDPSVQLSTQNKVSDGPWLIICKKGKALVSPEGISSGIAKQGSSEPSGMSSQSEKPITNSIECNLEESSPLPSSRIAQSLFLQGGSDKTGSTSRQNSVRLDTSLPSSSYVPYLCAIQDAQFAPAAKVIHIVVVSSLKQSENEVDAEVPDGVREASQTLAQQPLRVSLQQSHDNTRAQPPLKGFFLQISQHD